MNAAGRGWILQLNAGQNYDTARGFGLPAKTGTGRITIRSSRLDQLQANRRMSPADASKMPKLRVTTGAFTPVIKTTGAPSTHWRLQGLGITLSGRGLMNTGNMIQLGDTTTENSPEKIPR